MSADKTGFFISEKKNSMMKTNFAFIIKFTLFNHFYLFYIHFNTLFKFYYTFNINLL